MKLWICDDEKEIVDELKARCGTYFEMKNMEVEVVGMKHFPEELASLSELRAASEERKLPDILLLDIDMPDRNGLEIKEELAELEKGPYIIFVTSHRETIEEAFGRNVIGFLNKPVEPMKFNKLMERALDYCRSSQTHVMVDGRKIFCADIIYLQTSGIYTKVHLKGGAFIELRKSLKEWETLLPMEDFFRISDNRLVNFAWVGQVEAGRIILETGETFDISRRKKKLCRKMFVRYAARKVRYR